MFIGHFGIGFGAKSGQQKIPLGTFFLAAQFLDLLWPTFLVFGLESVTIEPGNTKMTPLHFISYPYTHSLLLAIAWSLAFALIYYLIKKNKSSALLLGLCVLSHWILDLLVHGPDLPMLPGESAKYGFGLWNSPPIAILLEGFIFFGGLFLYVKNTRALNKTGKYSLWSLVIFLLIIHAMNILGPPPPDVQSIAWAGQLQWLFVIWAYWVDRHRGHRNSITMVSSNPIAKF